MAIYYFDSSAIVKRYVDEPGSIWIRQLCEQNRPGTSERLNLITVGEIALVEVSAAFGILVRRNLIPKKFSERVYRKFVDDFRTEYDLAHITSVVLLNAANLAQRYPLKAYDAMQLSLGLQSNASLKAENLSLTFVSGDDQLLRAAQAQGLTIDNPFAHIS